MQQNLMNIELVFNTTSKKCGTDIEISDMFNVIIEETQSKDLIDETYEKINELLLEMLIKIDKRGQQLMLENKSITPPK